MQGLVSTVDDTVYEALQKTRMQIISLNNAIIYRCHTEINCVLLPHQIVPILINNAAVYPAFKKKKA